MCIVSTAIVGHALHTLAACSCHTLSIVTSTCSVLTDCSIDASTIMPRHQDRTESNQITPAKQPPKHRCVCQPQSKSNQNQIPSRQTASNTRIVITVSTASHVQFVIPIGIPKRSGAGSSVCTTKRSCRCRCRCRCRTYNHNMLQVSQQRNHHEPLLLRSAGTVAAVLFETQNDESEVILRTHLLNRTALAARTLKKVAGTPSINRALQ